MSKMKYWRISPGQGGYLWREQKLNEWVKRNVEFELCSSGFEAHLPDCENSNKKDRPMIVCWENDDWRDNRQRKPFEIIELKAELEKIL